VSGGFLYAVVYFQVEVIGWVLSVWHLALAFAVGEDANSGKKNWTSW
jgi:hypothetical protein